MPSLVAPLISLPSPLTEFNQVCPGVQKALYLACVAPTSKQIRIWKQNRKKKLTECVAVKKRETYISMYMKCFCCSALELGNIAWLWGIRAQPAGSRSLDINQHLGHVDWQAKRQHWKINLSFAFWVSFEINMNVVLESHLLFFCCCGFGCCCCCFQSQFVKNMPSTEKKKKNLESKAFHKISVSDVFASSKWKIRWFCRVCITD